jgi:uncharacterized protein YjiS (DUF1127 family)
MLQSVSASLGRASRFGADGFWAECVAMLRLLARTLVTRQELSDLSDRQLADIGVTRPVALAEATRRPWDVAPRHYR